MWTTTAHIHEAAVEMQILQHQEEFWCSQDVSKRDGSTFFISILLTLESKLKITKSQFINLNLFCKFILPSLFLRQLIMFITTAPKWNKAIIIIMSVCSYKGLLALKSDVILCFSKCKQTPTFVQNHSLFTI